MTGVMTQGDGAATRGAAGGASARVFRIARRRLPLSVLALLAAAAAQASDKAAEAPAGALSVSVKRAREMCFKDQVEVTGTISARREVDVGPTRDGYVVSQVLVEPLESVSAGQALAQLAPVEGAPGGAGTIALRSPVAGVVSRNAAVAGMPASPRQGGLFRIVANGEMDLRAEAPIDDLKKLSVGQKVVVTPLGAPPAPAKVQFIAPSVDPASQLGRVKIAIDSGRSLQAGVFARGVILVAERCGTGVPYSSIMYQPDGTIVHVVADNRVVARRVEVGLLSGTDVEIRSGVTADDLVVIRSGPFLRDGDLVVPIRVDETPTADAGRDRVSRGESR
ncbi:efflux RND transporter periplasmic adaptor subunit [Methylosinus sp. Sm6]|uniref:efflux RND transporter periplasmic adaptor subunit n=1 Tax=Methylosinus sp. Sm6 TaxID=2866948 RepID=UPI001C99615D|nr:HlyD family efflux transporter periplasmic adaptor subunit [Methylosinus sp. Sm6]MBY6241274.1 efflux RND transporter periplasmic adaptor subunit [Methylosinus sp. Sm6]